MPLKLSEGESYVATVHRHWLIHAVALLPFVLGGIVVLYLRSIFVEGMLPGFLGGLPFIQFPEAYVHVAVGIALLLLWFGAMHVFTDYYLDTWVITSHRIMGIKQRGFFNRRINSFRVERIQDVKTDVSGFFQTLFGIGDVHVETAGHQHDMIMRTVPNPRAVKERIMNVVDATTLRDL